MLFTKEIKNKVYYDNNQSITTFKTFGNPNLKCITVDDPKYSMENWKEIDEWTEFSEDCSTDTATIVVPRKDSAKVAANIMSQLPVQDVTIEEPPIDAIIREVRKAQNDVSESIQRP